jgi:hypothetical protein
MNQTHADAIPSISSVPVRPSLGEIQRCGGVRCPPGTCDHDDRPAIQRHSNAGSLPTGVPASVSQALESAGSPLNSSVRVRMETLFGHDFGHVRVHTDDAAARSATAIQAQAYTFGDHVVMGANSWQPDTAAGRRLLAHELTHVIQQGGQAAASPTAIGDPGTDAEREASQFAKSIGADVGLLAGHDLSRIPIRANAAAAKVESKPSTGRGAISALSDELRKLRP